MTVVEFEGTGGPEVLRHATRPVPECGAHDVVIEVIAAAVNRPDIQQRRGLYPPPAGASDLPGLDVAGIVVQAGQDVDTPKVGDAVCALANGGGYAEYCAVPAQQCMPIPQGFTYAQAASLPEVFFTAWNNVMLLGRLAPGETLLVQGGTSGVGMAAIQMAIALRQARVFATAGTEEKRQICRDFGAIEAFDYRADWDAQLRAQLGGQGVDVVLDGQAGPYTQKQLDLLAYDGRVVLIASHLGAEANINLRQLVRRRQTLCGSTLRPRSADYKGAIATALVRDIWPLLEAGKIKTRLHETVAFDDVQYAHRILDENLQIGKVVLAVDSARVETAPRP
ncbi:NAD(P)H-quinone oxidoreductase [Cognatishimia sp. SS12]|uniref:NAD(P)H-quinone oxidoreductase n=1 Tax=Cognatishimia sp. SS12 TaxID=2979465 RepID=UPI00232F98BE|nr:NAD(P)H-quinone oxidoreductase [Cognatishimia sp. SS12]MDC0739344.1 NAD(P)H-quinone oxidoreductase [Cognatishimia sp. SS12]